uniref:Uncharacterized protein n=1 Tax=Nothoprocta perdicaria TaxID=30464 RepID=A0A8C7EG07_NOTPE
LKPRPTTPPRLIKVDGFTRKSVRKAQRQKRSQGSSQFRGQGSAVELAPLPQLKGTARAARGAGSRVAPGRGGLGGALFGIHFPAFGHRVCPQTRPPISGVRVGHAGREGGCRLAPLQRQGGKVYI